MKYCRVILDIQSNEFSNAITYCVCEQDDKSSSYALIRESILKKFEFKELNEYQVQVGSTVVVPFGKQLKLGFVIEVINESDLSGNEVYKNFKPVVCAVTEPLFTKNQVDFAKFLSKKYICSLATCIRIFIPTGSTAKLKHTDGIWVAKVHHFRKLKKDSIEKYFKADVNPVKDWDEFVLTDGQNKALSCISSSIDNQSQDVYVLDGVTGSGKTEVYLRAIDKVVALGKTACVLVPEISLTPQTLSRFSQRFDCGIAVIHSKMTLSERYNQYEKIKSGQAKIVIGARSALFSSLENLGIIIIDEEHENSYKQDKSPRYNTRDCAVWLAKNQNAVLVLGSATPSMESLHACDVYDNWYRIELPERTNKKPMPEIQVVDMANEFKGGSRSLFSHKLKNSILQELKAGHKVVLFHNRRGFSNYMFCRNCGYTPTCDKCSTYLTYHQTQNSAGGMSQFLICHHCGKKYNVPVTCPECESVYIAKYGAGTQNVSEQLRAILNQNDLSDVEIVRMDADTTSDKFSHQELLQQFSKPGPAVLLGTQMIAKGLDFDTVTLVGVILIDTNLSLPDFRSAERTFNMILQVSGRCGRGDLPGKVIIQTYTPDEISIECASKYNKKLFLDIESNRRKIMHYPPFYSLANFVVSGINEHDVQDKIDEVFNLLNDYKQNNKIDDWELMPPTACVFEKIRNMYRFHVLLKMPFDKDYSSEISAAIKPYKKKAHINLIVDIDPISLM